MKKELVLSAIRHVETEKVPYGIYFTTAAIEKYKKQLEDDFLDSELKAAVKDGFFNFYEALAIGMGNHVISISIPWWNWKEVDHSYYTSFTPPDYIPKTAGYGSYSHFEEKSDYLQKKGFYVLGTAYGSHFEKANFCRGIENFLADLAGEPDYAKKLLGEIIRKNLVMLENIVNSNLDGVLLGSDWGSQQSMLMSPAIWRELIKPGEIQEYEIIKKAGKHVWIHSCGNIEQIIPDLVEMGIDVLNPVQPEVMDIYELKANYGTKLTFWGGITTQRILPHGSPDEVMTETRNVISGMSRGGGFITSPSQAYQVDVPYINTIALLEEARNYRNIID
ncbi:MAG: hypothetical protein JXQ23_01085 [Clostridia bacterium]|nr:hypothetical protein [Clostridia bacterium]